VVAARFVLRMFRIMAWSHMVLAQRRPLAGSYIGDHDARMGS
jgi:hypothetical protein